MKLWFKVYWLYGQWLKLYQQPLHKTHPLMVSLTKVGNPCLRGGSEHKQTNKTKFQRVVFVYVFQKFKFANFNFLLLDCRTKLLQLK